jgi:two-component system, OmpR family, response regulator
MSYRFLLIGDNKDHWRMVLQSALSSLGEMDVCSQHKSLEFALAKEYDVVILDAAAVEDEQPLISQLRSRKRRLPIVVVTAAPAWKRARKVFLAGATDYILKSYDKEELLAALREYC